jgi:PA domain
MVSFRLSGALLVAAAPSMVFSGTPDNVSSKLMVHVPHKLFKEGGYEHREALFGRPPYGGSISQSVYYVEDDLCDMSKPVLHTFPKDVNEKGEVILKSPFIMMVNRGNCAFVQKVRNAQRNGAAGVVIADNVCLCSDSECMSQQQQNGESPPCETAEPVMADDGSGSDVSIPSFLMFKHDADKVKEELMKNRPVRLEMQWSLPHPDSRVEYDLFSSPTDPVARNFFDEFKPIAKALGSHAFFTPHMYVFDGVRSQCHGMNGENQCFNLCSNNGRYCAMDPDKNLEDGVSGFDVVKESLRRHCIWSNYGEIDGIGEKWWDYVAEFDKRCGSMDYFNNPDCVRDVYKHANVDEDLIERCMDNSGGLEKDTTNSFLEAELKAQTALGVVIMPTAFVNKVAIRGAMSVANVFEAVCAGFAAGSKPQICTTCSHCGDPAKCVHHGQCTAHMGGLFVPGEGVPQGSVSNHTFYGWMFLIVAAFSVAAVWHYKKSRDDMREQVRTILADYMPLTDSESGPTSGQGGAHGFAGSAQMAVQNMMGMSGSSHQGHPGASQYSPVGSFM